MLNRFGQCLKFNKLEELETATAEQIQERQLSCPEGTVVGRTMGLAFDNYDELTQTLSGADTLHDTMGIYQNVPTADDAEVGRSRPTNRAAATQQKNSRKQTLGVDTGQPFAPYRKVPKMI